MRVLSAWLLALALMLMPGVPATVSSASTVVTQCDDAGFNAALASAQAGDTISFNCGGPATIPVLSTKRLATNLTIDGSNNGSPVIFSGADARRVFSVTVGSAVTLRNLTVRDGKATGEQGGGINNAGFLTLDGTQVLNNSAASGGGVYSNGALTVTGSRFAENQSEGIHSVSGTVVVQNSEFATHAGTGVSIGDGNAVISATRFISNGTGLSVGNGTVSLTGSTVAGNARNGAAVFTGALTVSDTDFTDNTNIFANCAALCSAFGNVGTLSVTRSRFVDNVSTSSVGGASAIYAGNIVTVTDSLFTGNRTTGTSTGTINVSTGSPDTRLTIGNSTLSANSNTGSITSTAAIIAIGSAADVRVANVTVAGNTGVGLARTNGTLAVTNTIVAANSVANCAGTITNGGHNLASAGCPGFTTGDPKLGPLADNGGPTLTYALLTDSPAIDAGDNAACPAADQRGVARPQDGDGNGTATCDVGAFEYLRSSLALSPASQTVVVGASGLLTVTLSPAQPVTTVVTLTSTNSAIVSVPATITVPANQASKSVSLTGVAAGGPVTVQAGLPAALGSATAQATVTVANPVPTISSISPNSVVAGSGGFSLQVTGSGFASGAVVRWNGTDRPTTFVDGTHLTAQVSAADVALTGTASVTVFNPTPGGGASSAQTVTIQAPATATPTATPVATPVATPTPPSGAFPVYLPAVIQGALSGVGW